MYIYLMVRKEINKKVRGREDGRVTVRRGCELEKKPSHF